jgi:hypothetical protein
VHLLAGTIQRFEKTESLDMIHMEVGEEKIDARLLSAQLLSQRADSCAGIEDDQGPIITSYLDT